MDGWKYTVENPEEALNITMKYSKDSVHKHQKYMLEQSIPLIHTGNSLIGIMETSKWALAQDILFEEKIILKKEEIDNVFTNKFIDKVYS